MTGSNFKFLEEEFPLLFNICYTAELNLYNDPATSLTKFRLFGELLAKNIFQQHALDLPGDLTFHGMLKALYFQKIITPPVSDLLFTIKGKGNAAAHGDAVSVKDAETTLAGSFKVAIWFFETYAKEPKVISESDFMYPQARAENVSRERLEQDYLELQQKFNALMATRTTDGISLAKQEEITKRSTKSARKIDMSEALTRKMIDEQLREAGWEADTELLNNKTAGTLPEANKCIAIAEWPVGNLWADYALFIGTTLFGIVEAKKYMHDISTDLYQSAIYAENIGTESNFTLLGKWRSKKVPFLFSTNGRSYLEQIKTKSGIWFLDVRLTYNISRPLKGWYSPSGLKELWERDIAQANKEIASSDIGYLANKNGLALRPYQLEAIKAVESAIINNPEQRRLLIAMATGTGKTRTVVGLCYQLIKFNRFKRILFLVDRTLLGIQSGNDFRAYKVDDNDTFADVYGLRELAVASPETVTRLHFATVQSMVKRIFHNSSGEAPTVDSYDCVIIDEAHRGYLLDREIDEDDLDFKDQQDYVSKYRMVLDYFDCHAIGLTATPALHTHEIFGSPVYTYSYREAVIDGYLIDHDTPYIIHTQLSQNGVHWNRGERPKAFDSETNSIIELEELQDELNIDVTGFNRQVDAPSFNETVVKELVSRLDPDDRQKTLIFAVNNDHADKIVQLLKEGFHDAGINVADDAIRKITGKVYNNQELVNLFRNEQYPSIVVTVDLLTTGIDVPAITNLVFLRRVKSRILFEQMLGRATRRCDEIDKEVFNIYDAVGIYEALEDFTQMRPVVANPRLSFKDLQGELVRIYTPDRQWKQIEQIIAKLQRKKGGFLMEDTQAFIALANMRTPDNLIEDFKNRSIKDVIDDIRHLSPLWAFLDDHRPTPAKMLLSEQPDALLGVERSFGTGQKPGDYLESFATYIENNRNNIAALNIICTKPNELDKKTLKELSLLLSSNGFKTADLNAAWKQAKNQDIAANIISFIRTLALGSTLVSHEDRVKMAIQKVRSSQPWTRVQQNWLDKFERQLLIENVLSIRDLDDEPYDESGGFYRLNKIFDERLATIINEINNSYYQIA